MEKNQLFLPISILIASIIFGGFFYISEIDKQRSIERQQEIKLKHDTEVNKLKATQEEADKIFSNNLKCQSLLKDLKQRWNNVVGIRYSDILNTCIVKYTEKGEVQESSIESMQDSN